MLTELIAAFKKAAWPMSGQLFHGVLFFAAILAPGLNRLEAQTPEIIPLDRAPTLAAGGIPRRARAGGDQLF